MMYTLTQKFETDGNHSQYCLTKQFEDGAVAQKRLITWDGSAISFQMTEYNKYGWMTGYQSHIIPYENSYNFSSDMLYRSNGKWRRWADSTVTDRCGEKWECKGMIPKTAEEIVVPGVYNGNDSVASIIPTGLTGKQQKLFVMLNQSRDIALADLIEEGRPAKVASMAMNMDEEVIAAPEPHDYAMAG